MFEKIKGNKTFTKLMKRQNINLSYAMVEPSDSWYNIISTIHNSLNEMNPSGNIIIHGLSMGGGIAFHLVDKNIKNVKCFIIDAPNHSLKNFFKEAVFEFYKKNQDKITFYTIQRFEKEFNTDINKSEIVDIASNSKYPILLTAGSNEDFEEIFATVKSRNPKDTEIVILPECDHANGMYRQTAMYQNSIIEFVNKYLGK